MPKTHKLHYRMGFKPGNFTKADKQHPEEGLADALLLICLHRSETNKIGLVAFGIDGTNPDPNNTHMSDEMLEAIWAKMTLDLSSPARATPIGHVIALAADRLRDMAAPDTDSPITRELREAYAKLNTPAYQSHDTNKDLN